MALPYIAMKTGIWLMLLYFLVITALLVVISLIFCQISLKTPDFKRFPGFAGHYLGKWGWIFGMASIVIGIFIVLLVYLIIGGQFLTAIFQPIFSGNVLTYTLVYFVAACAILYFDINVISRATFLGITLLFVSLCFVFVEGFSQIKISNIFISSPDWLHNLFLPYGALLFALWGIGLVPEVEEMLSVKKKNLKKVVIISTIVVSVFYFLFTLLILGITGAQTAETALVGLIGFLPKVLISIALFFGALATFTAFIAQGIILKKTLMFDLKIKRNHAFIITCFTPLILLLLGLSSFIPLLSLTGGVLIGIDGILILLMYKKIYPVKSGEAGISAKQKLFNYWVGGKNIIIYPLSVVFLLGLIYEIVYFLKII